MKGKNMIISTYQIHHRQHRLGRRRQPPDHHPGLQMTAGQTFPELFLFFGYQLNLFPHTDTFFSKASPSPTRSFSDDGSVRTEGPSTTSHLVLATCSRSNIFSASTSFTWSLSFEACMMIVGSAKAAAGTADEDEAAQSTGATGRSPPSASGPGTPASMDQQVAPPHRLLLGFCGGCPSATTRIPTFVSGGWSAGLGLSKRKVDSDCSYSMALSGLRTVYINSEKRKLLIFKLLPYSIHKIASIFNLSDPKFINISICMSP